MASPLGQATVPERIPYAREPRKLPVVLSADEVVQFLEAVSSLKSRAALTAAGLRASEVAGLRVEDVDSGRGVILVDRPMYKPARLMIQVERCITEMGMRRRALSLLAVGSAVVCMTGAVFAADVMVAPIGRPVLESNVPASCLRWVWQQYSWYDDCWASRYPYIGGRVAVRASRR